MLVYEALSSYCSKRTRLDVSLQVPPKQELKASYTSGLRPHTLAACSKRTRLDVSLQVPPKQELKASYTSSLRPHTLVA